MFKILIYCIFFFQVATLRGQPKPDVLLVKSTPDFTLTGNVESEYWKKTSWIALQQLDSGSREESRFKILYSKNGIYVLMQGKDSIITSHFTEDFDTLFKGDVFEIFLHTDTTMPLYFEYEISPLNKELILFIPQFNGKIGGWTPWRYGVDGNKTEKVVILENGQSKNGSALQSWTVEVFFPYILLHPLKNVPPKKGQRWKANFYRLDYDTGKMVKWAWSPVKKSFHEIHRFGTLQFD